MKILLLILLFTHVSCNLNTNTVDPQASESILSSKSKKVFIKEFISQNKSDSLFSVNEAWIEFTWKNINETRIETTGSRQLIISLKQKEKLQNMFGYYLTNWYLYSTKYGYFGSGNGVYDLSINDTSLPSSVGVKVFRLDSLRRASLIGQINLIQKE